jgi:hypothetical protein
MPEQFPKRSARRVARCLSQRLPEQLPQRVAECEPIRTADPVAVAITAADADPTRQPITWPYPYVNAGAWV